MTQRKTRNFTVEATVSLPLTAGSDKEAAEKAKEMLASQQEGFGNPVTVHGGKAAKMDGYDIGGCTHAVDLEVSVEMAAKTAEDARERAVRQLKFPPGFRGSQVEATVTGERELARFGVSLTLNMDVYADDEQQAVQRAMNYIDFDDLVIRDVQFNADYEDAVCLDDASAQSAPAA